MTEPRFPRHTPEELRAIVSRVWENILSGHYAATPPSDVEEECAWCHRPMAGGEPSERLCGVRLHTACLIEFDQWTHQTS